VAQKLATIQKGNSSAYLNKLFSECFQWIKYVDRCYEYTGNKVDIANAKQIFDFDVLDNMINEEFGKMPSVEMSHIYAATRDVDYGKPWVIRQINIAYEGLLEIVRVLGDAVQYYIPLNDEESRHIREVFGSILSHLLTYIRIVYEIDKIDLDLPEPVVNVHLNDYCVRNSLSVKETCNYLFELFERFPTVYYLFEDLELDEKFTDMAGDDADRFNEFAEYLTEDMALAVIGNHMDADTLYDYLVEKYRGV
jgi:hypothetical protein